MKNELDVSDLNDVTASLRERELQDRKDALQYFLEENKDRLKQWYDAHPAHSAAPIYYDEARKEFFWANRKLRRSTRTR